MLPASALPVIPDTITFAAPVIVALLSGWLGQAHFPAWANALIALGVLFVVTIGCILIGARFTGDPVVDTILVLTYATALMYGPFRVIQKYLILGPSSQLPAVRQDSLPSVQQQQEKDIANS